MWSSEVVVNNDSIILQGPHSEVHNSSIKAYTTNNSLYVNGKTYPYDGASTIRIDKNIYIGNVLVDSMPKYSFLRNNWHYIAMGTGIVACYLYLFLPYKKIVKD
jgi:hypothetical protein